MGRLFRSRKFWVLVMDLVISIILYFATKYAAPALAGDIKFIIAVIQPVFLLMIGAIAYEDKAAMGAGYRPWE